MLPTSARASAVTTAPYRHQARVLVHAPVQQVAELVPPTVGILRAQGPRSRMLTTGSDSLDALAFHLAELGAEFTVLEPPELIEHIRGVARCLLRGAPTASPGGAVPGPGRGWRQPP